MKKILIQFFALSKTEFNGILVLIVLIVSVLIAAETYFYFSAQNNLSIEKWSDSSILMVEKQNHIQQSFQYKNTIKSVHLYDFDPNTAQISNWMDFGLTEKQAQSILNYLAKGGKFNKKEDLKKMFVISPTLYKQLEPHIVIENSVRFLNSVTAIVENKPHFSPKIIEINEADTTDFKQLKGIGTVFAARIVKYRNRLGGFHDVSQLREVFGMSDSLFQKIQPFLKVNSQKVQKININTATFSDLRKIPYWNNKQINVLIQYRNQHGSFLSEKDLEKIVVLSQETIQKVAPYLQYD